MVVGGGKAQSGDALGPVAWQLVDRLPSDLSESNARFARRALDPGEERPLIWCDAPVVDAAPLVDPIALVTGWAVGHAPVVEVTVELAGQPARSAARRFDRPDVGLVHSWAPDAAESGFRLLLDVGMDALGPQRLLITARDDRGRTTSLWRWVVVDPQRSYRRWLDGRDPMPVGGIAELVLQGEVQGPTFAVAVLPGDDEDGLRATRFGLRRGSYTKWRFLDTTDAPRDPVDAALARFLDGEDEYLVFVDSGSRVERHALLAFAEAARLSEPPDLIYADDDIVDHTGRRSRPRFKPGWSPERLLCQNYVGSFVAVSRGAAQRARDADAASVDSVYELMLRLIDTYPWVERVADVLVSRPSPAPSQETTVSEARSVESLAQRRGIPAQVETLTESHVRRVSWDLQDCPEVSIVIPTAGAKGMLARCVTSIRARSTYANLELVIVDDSAGLLEPSELPLDGIKHQIVSHHGDFNFSRLINLGAAAANGDQLLILNDDTEVQTPDWIERLLEWGQLPGVGVVGPKLLYAEGLVQQAGVALTDLHGLVGQVLAGLPDEGPGPGGALVCVRNWAAVGLTCALVSRADFDAVGGMDEELAVELGDVDFTLRLLAAGRRVVWTPHAVLLHHERASRGGGMHALDHERFRVRWDRLLRTGDPFGNPNLNGGDDLRIREPGAAARAAARAKVRAPGDGPPIRPDSPDMVGGRGGARGASLRPSVERLEPEVAGGSLVLAEHEARYRWAAAVVAGLEVVDAGCGVGYGARICVEARAAAVLGFDASAPAIADAHAAAQAWPDRTMAGRVRYEVRDLLDSGLPTASCDVALCFEAIEHVADPERAIDELHRVVRRGGLLLVSSPNPGVYPSGNPHHVRELEPEQLRELLRSRFRNVRLFPQHAWAASLLGDGEMHAAADGAVVLDARLSKLAAGEPGRSLYTVAAASDGRLPALGALAVLARADEADHLRERLAYASGRSEELAGELKRERARSAIAEREASRARGEPERQGEGIWRIGGGRYGWRTAGAPMAAVLRAGRSALASRVRSR